MKYTNLIQKTATPLMAILLPGLLSAQGGVGLLRISNGANLSMTGPVNLVLNDVSFINDGNFSAGSSKVVFTGIKTTLVGGSHLSGFNNFTLNKASNNVKLTQHTTVMGSLTMVRGNLNLNNFDLNLGNTGTIINERHNCNILGPTGGRITVIRTMKNPDAENPGNIGVEITSPVNLGTVTIIRTHIPQLLQSGGQSIQRSFNIIPSTNSGLDVSLKIFYLDNELNGAVENDLQLWSSSGINTFPTLIGRDANDINANWVSKSELDQMGVFTLAGGGIAGDGETMGANHFGSGSTETVIEKTSMQIFPNPSHNKFTIEFKNSLERDVTFKLIDQNGHLLQKKKVYCQKGINLIQWDIGNYPAGVYFLVAEKMGRRNIKILKK